MGVGLLALLLQILYAVGALGLGLYGLHALWLVVQSRRFVPPLPADGCDPTHLPAVTVQLPVYNERHVVLRLIDACAALDYPQHLLQIQVLDDSTDQTTAIIQQRVDFWRSRGANIQTIHRIERTGYKAGALHDALPTATGEFIAIFDADFEPPTDFLARTIPHFLGDNRAKIGFVQARWGHLNQDYSVLTNCQALALDGHFVVEQVARQSAGYPFGFNGSGGVWRRACIEDPAVGGWQADTLCEDLDLSYRAQLAGWRPLFLPDLVAPAEIPPQLLAFKRQQFRWAKGSVQTLKKLGGAVWRSHWSLPARLAGLFHLGNYLVHPLLLLLLLVMPLLMLLDAKPFEQLGWLSLTSAGPPLLYAIAQWRISRRLWLRRWAYLPILTFFGIGLCLSNTLAVWQALTNRPSPFLRTPKFRVQDRKDSWRGSSYALTPDPTMLGESLLALYALGSALGAAVQNIWWPVPFLLLYGISFVLMVAMGAGHASFGLRRKEEPTWIDLVKS